MSPLAERTHGTALSSANGLAEGETPGRGAAPESDPARPGLAFLLALALCSGACGLTYQTAWLRELRLVFGISTAATAATVAIFMGGLGLGSLWLGSRADRTGNPLRLFAGLEIGIAAAAALSPTLLAGVREAYRAMGGSFALGPLAGTLVRLLLTATVLGVPAVLMGGTLPALGRAVASRADVQRGRLALVYAVNTLGAVAGVVITTFVLLEHVGAHAAIWLAAALNLAAGLTAAALARSRAHEPARLALVTSPDPAPAARVAPGRVYAAAAIVGFVFFLMEIVWYRMLTPLLGGTVYTFGLILAVALIGISLGSLLYRALPGAAIPTLGLFASTCALEAIVLAIPFALGDRLAILTMILGPLRFLGLAGGMVAWGTITAIVVLPAAVVAGLQFPLLVRLLGGGETDLGRHTGRAYAWNTAGAIAGSLAGGFGLLPWLSAPGVWRLAVALLALLSVTMAVLASRAQRSFGSLMPALGGALCALLLVMSTSGPTGFWRHSGIAAGTGGKLDDIRTANDRTRLIHQNRHRVLWEADGRESSIAATCDDAMSLIVGGKSDGSITGDAGTQIMIGMTGALLHPSPRRALVIGLGTGSTSGWLGQVPSIERVDTIELEPGVLKFAREAGVANHHVTDDPKQRIRIGDGREFIQTTRESYDLIVSEPSNPYRAGVASLFTREFYAAAERRLREGGLFLQWLQAYDADFETIRVVYATLGSVFPNVETWTTEEGDLLLVGSRAPVTADVPALRARIRQEPYRTALQRAWRVRDLEGVLARYLGNGAYATAVAASGPLALNTDDRTVLEYRFARQLDQNQHVDFDDLRVLARMGRHAAPPWTGLDQMDRAGVDVQRAALHVEQMDVPPPPPATSSVRDRIIGLMAYVRGDHEAAYQLWHTRDVPSNLTELAAKATVMCERGDPTAQALIDDLGRDRPVEAGFLSARLQLVRGNIPAAAAAYEAACLAYREDPWVWPFLARRQLMIGSEIVARGDSLSRARVWAALQSPFAVSSSDMPRLVVMINVARRLDGDVPGEFTRRALDAYGEPIAWDEEALVRRAQCFRNLGDPRAARAEADLKAFGSHLPRRVPLGQAQGL